MTCMCGNTVSVEARREGERAGLPGRCSRCLALIYEMRTRRTQEKVLKHLVRVVAQACERKRACGKQF